MPCGLWNAVVLPLMDRKLDLEKRLRPQERWGVVGGQIWCAVLVILPWSRLNVFLWIKDLLSLYQQKMIGVYTGSGVEKLNRYSKCMIKYISVETSLKLKV